MRSALWLRAARNAATTPASAHVQFVRFCLVGVLNTAITYAVFFSLYHGLRLHYLAASAVGYLVGLANSYLVNRAWTFRGFSDGTGGEMARFVAVNAVALGANLGALRLLV